VLRCGAGIARADATGGAAWRRHAPSSGALGSATVYPIVIRVSGIDAGIYHYDGTGHDLALVRRGRLESWLRERVLYQREFSLAAVVLVVASAIAPLAERYGIRGYRLALLDAGHVSQNLQLAAAALGLSACAVAGFIDSELDDALGLDGVSDASLLCVAMGPPPETGSP
jgi:SagB-type dehydrogenase family enzyme